MASSSGPRCAACDKSFTPALSGNRIVCRECLGKLPDDVRRNVLYSKGTGRNGRNLREQVQKAIADGR